MPEQLELFSSEPFPLPEQATPPHEGEGLDALSDNELKARLADALRLLAVGNYYDIFIDTPGGKRLVLDRDRIIPFLQDKKLAEDEIARRHQETANGRTSGPGGVD